MIIVLDTNIIVSALQFRRSGTVIDRMIARATWKDSVAICAEIKDELRRTLIRKFSWSEARVQIALDALFLRAMHVEIKGAARRCRDPHDDMFLECAEVADAEFLITGDKDLLVLGSHKRTRIIRPTDCVSLGS